VFYRGKILLFKEVCFCCVVATSQRRELPGCPDAGCSKAVKLCFNVHVADIGRSAICSGLRDKTHCKLTQPVRLFI
jgi:hypothetical protein